MHPEILSKNQVGLLSLIGKFMGDFGLVGGTALALQLGHRRSIDFDLFSNRSFDGEKIRSSLRREFPIEQTLVESSDELTVVINNVKITLYFVLKDHGLREIADEAKKIFGPEFNEKLFRAQLAYFDDIDYGEQVEYLPSFETDDSTIKEFLRETSLSK